MSAPQTSAFAITPVARRLRINWSRLIRCGSSSFRPAGSCLDCFPSHLAAGQAPDLSVVNRRIRRVGLSPTYLVSFTGCFGAMNSGGRLALSPAFQILGQNTKPLLAPPPPRRYFYPMIANPDSRSPGSIPNNRCETLAPPVPILPRATPAHRRVPSSGKSPGGVPHAPMALVAPVLPIPILPPPISRAHPHETRVNRTSCAQNDSPVTLSRTPPAVSLPARSLPPPPNTANHPHETRVNSASCAQNDSPVTLSRTLPAVSLPARSPSPPPNTAAHPHETRVNRTSCTQNDPPFTLSNPLPSPRKSTFPSPEQHQPPTPSTVKPRPFLGEPSQTLACRLHAQSYPPVLARLPRPPHSKSRGGCPQNRFDVSLWLSASPPRPATNRITRVVNTWRCP